MGKALREAFLVSNASVAKDNEATQQFLLRLRKCIVSDHTDLQAKAGSLFLIVPQLAGTCIKTFDERRIIHCAAKSGKAIFKRIGHGPWAFGFRARASQQWSFEIYLRLNFSDRFYIAQFVHNSEIIV